MKRAMAIGRPIPVPPQDGAGIYTAPPAAPSFDRVAVIETTAAYEAGQDVGSDVARMILDRCAQLGWTVPELLDLAENAPVGWMLGDPLSGELGETTFLGK